MIRFACPGCGASYSVDDNKAGKSGKCPKCASQFQIPQAGSSGGSPDAFPAPPPPPPPPAPLSSGGTVEIDPCPGCQARLSVGASDIGIDVECPYCKTIYRAARSGDRPSSPPPSKRVDDEPAPRPSKRRSRDDDDRPVRRDEDEDRPSRRKARDEDEDERPSRRRSRRDEDDDDDDRPRRRRGRRSNADYEPHRGGMILTFAILGWAICAIFGIVAWVMGSADIKKMDAGIMDPEGRGLTQAGRIIGMIQTILLAIVFLLYCVLAAVGAGGGGK